MQKVTMAIFGQLGTANKVFFPCFEGQIQQAMQSLNKQYGGDWVYCEALKPGEGIKFTDTQVYRGFSPNIKRYSVAIIEIKAF
jgi:hypothetical protein